MPHRPAGGEADEELDDDEAAAAGERLNAVYERLQEMGSATAEARAAKILHGLGVAQAPLRPPPSSYALLCCTGHRLACRSSTSCRGTRPGHATCMWCGYCAMGQACVHAPCIYVSHMPSNQTAQH